MSIKAFKGYNLGQVDFLSKHFRKVGVEFYRKYKKAGGDVSSSEYRTRKEDLLWATSRKMEEVVKEDNIIKSYESTTCIRCSEIPRNIVVTVRTRNPDTRTPGTQSHGSFDLFQN